MPSGYLEKNILGWEIIDQCIIITFDRGESYSGEKTVEIHCHGSIAIIKKLISVLSECGKHLE